MDIAMQLLYQDSFTDLGRLWISLILMTRLSTPIFHLGAHCRAGLGAYMHCRTR